MMQQGVDHDIADKVDFVFINPLFQQILFAALFSDEQKIRNLIRQYPVDFLRHSAIKTAQPGLHVDQLHALFHRNQATGNGRVDIADNNHQIGFIL